MNSKVASMPKVHMGCVVNWVWTREHLGNVDLDLTVYRAFNTLR